MLSRKNLQDQGGEGDQKGGWQRAYRKVRRRASRWREATRPRSTAKVSTVPASRISAFSSSRAASVSAAVRVSRPPPPTLLPDHHPSLIRRPLPLRVALVFSIHPLISPGPSMLPLLVIYPPSHLARTLHNSFVGNGSTHPLILAGPSVLPLLVIHPPSHSARNFDASPVGSSSSLSFVLFLFAHERVDAILPPDIL